MNAVSLSRVVVWLVLLCACASIFAGELGMELLPPNRPFHLAIADPREVSMGLQFTGDSKIEAVVGNYISFFAIRPKDKPDDWTIHFGLEGAGFFTMRHADSRFPLETTDGLFGFYLEGASGPWQAQLRYTHISAHLSDGSVGTPIAYSREFATLRGAWVPDDRLQIYAGPQYLVNSTPILPGLGFEWGGSYFLPVDSRLAPFAALDMKWKQESPANPSMALQLGLALNRPPRAYRSFRFFYSYYTGQDPRGQYYMNVYTAHSFGLEMQI